MPQAAAIAEPSATWRRFRLLYRNNERGQLQSQLRSPFVVRIITVDLVRGSLRPIGALFALTFASIRIYLYMYEGSKHGLHTSTAINRLLTAILKQQNK